MPPRTCQGHFREGPDSSYSWSLHQGKERPLTGRSRIEKTKISAHAHHLLALPLLVLAALLVLAGFAEVGLTFSWLTTFFTPSVCLATRSASVFASAVSTVPRKV